MRRAWLPMRDNGSVVFERRLQTGLTEGSIRAFRRWRRLQVVAGRGYGSRSGLIEVEAVMLVTDRIEAIDAQPGRRAGGLS